MLKRFLFTISLGFFFFQIPFFALAEEIKISHETLSQEILSKHEKQKNLKSLIETLLSANPEIQSLLYKIQAAKDKVSQESWLDDPKLGVQASNLPASDLSLSRTPMSGVQVSITQKVPFPSKIATRKKIQKAKLNQTQKIYLEQINQLISKFKQSYFEYSYVQEAILIHKKNKSRLHALKNHLQSKYTTDEIPLQDLLKIKVAIGQIDNTLISLTQMSKTYQTRLNTLLVRNTDTKINTPARKNLNSYPTDLKTLIEKAKTQRPWIKKLDFEILEQQKQSSLAKQSLLPDFDFMGGYRFRENVPGDPVNGEDFLSGGVSMTLPFPWSIPKHAKKISEAKNNLRAKEKEKQAALQELTYQVSAHFQELKQLKNQIGIMNSQIIPASLSSFESSKRSYEAGVVDFLDVISAQNSLFMHELNLVKYKYDYEKKRSLLEMSVGDYF